MPAATPQTAARSTRSQSPPRLVQRSPVSAIAQTMATSSVIPYMWIDSGPMSRVPVDGDGNVARRLDIEPHSAGFAARGLEKDSRGQIRRAAALDELEGEVEVDLGVLGQVHGNERLVAGLQQLARAPGGHAVGFGVEVQLGVGRIRHRTYFGSLSPF